jgi:predicted CXXCH cytochrome family protein
MLMSARMSTTPSSSKNDWKSGPQWLVLACVGVTLSLPAGLEAGHVTGPVPRDVARSGVGAIADDVDLVSCMACHVPHGAMGTALLTLDARQSRACLACHSGVDPQRRTYSHPVGERIERASILQALRADQALMGPGGTVECLTCHRIHGDLDDPAFAPNRVTQRRCLECHPSQDDMMAGAHGMHDRTCRDGLPCLECHTLHGAVGPALGLFGGDLRDPTGCLACHDGSPADVSSSVDPQHGHPLFEPNPAPARLPSVGRDGTLELGVEGDMGCMTCHDTHAPADADNPAMLRLPGGDAENCLVCHDEMRGSLGSDHDLRGGSISVDAELVDTMAFGGFCVACHGMHEDRARPGWDGEADPSLGLGQAGWSCLGCHELGNQLGATEVTEFHHPDDLLLTTANLPWSNTGELPLYDLNGAPTDDNEIGRITCMTCHDPHIWNAKGTGEPGRGDGDVRSSFLRDDWQGFCAGCHGEESIERYRDFHDPAFREDLERLRERRDWNLYQEE